VKKDKLQHIKTTKPGFKVPKGYFDTVEDAVFTKLSTEEFPEKEGFSAPDSYFSDLEDNVLKKIQGEKSSKQTGFSIPKDYLQTVEDTITARLDDANRPTKVIDFKSVILKRIIPFAAAASLLLFVVVKYNSKTVGFDTVASAEIEQWIENDLIALDTYEIADVYKDIELENSVLFSEDENELLEYLDGTDIESLLIEN